LAVAVLVEIQVAAVLVVIAHLLVHQEEAVLLNRPCLLPQVQRTQSLLVLVVRARLIPKR
jgi:hypothetical protein